MVGVTKVVVRTTRCRYQSFQEGGGRNEEIHDKRVPLGSLGTLTSIYYSEETSSERTPRVPLFVFEID